MKQKTKMFSMRFCQSDFDHIQHQAEKAEMNLTGYITAAALNQSIVVIDGLDNMIVELKAIGRNLNQLTMLCNMGKIQCLDLDHIRHDFGSVFDQIYALCARRN